MARMPFHERMRKTMSVKRRRIKCVPKRGRLQNYAVVRVGGFG